MNSKGMVMIVGAGPGDPDLISVKGVKAIQQADVILYDALVSIDLLNYASADCNNVYVGKRKGRKEFLQGEINNLLLFHAKRNKTVVRLKGGDPFVFGRGHEELRHLAEHGIHTQVIPGISTAIAGPSAAAIPLTKRGVNESFLVITGTLTSGEVSRDLEYAAKSSATIVILMGLSQLKQIVKIFTSARSLREPVALIASATLPQQKVCVGTLQNIEDQTKQSAIESPAVIIIGKVVEERAALMRIINETESITSLNSFS